MIMIFIYTTQIQRKFSNAPYNSKSLQLFLNQIYNSLQFPNQIKSNVGFWGEGKTGVPGEKPLGAEI